MSYWEDLEPLVPEPIVPEPTYPGDVDYERKTQVMEDYLRGHRTELYTMTRSGQVVRASAEVNAQHRAQNLKAFAEHRVGNLGGHLGGNEHESTFGFGTFVLVVLLAWAVWYYY